MHPRSIATTVTSVEDLSPLDKAILLSLAGVDRELGPDTCPDGRLLAQRVLEQIDDPSVTLASGRADLYFGMRAELTRLEELGLIDIDPGMAEFVPRGAPAPTQDSLGFRLTPAGERVIEELE
jgi:hypothetical protein